MKFRCGSLVLSLRICIALADWLQQCGVTTVAMESTGVYWIPLFELLERRGFEVKLVDARHVKECHGAQIRHSRLPMDPATTHLRSVGWGVSTCG